MVFGTVPKLHVSLGITLVSSALAIPLACSDPFSSCAASRTCEGDAKGGAGGEAGADDTGGTSGTSGSGASGTAGSAGAADGGEGGSSAGGGGGAPGEAGNGGESASGGQPSGGVGGGGTGGTGGMAPPLDTTPPTVLSVSPANGAQGVLANANIVITFSEPMNRATTEAAYLSTDIPASGVALTWNAESTVLTVNPAADLAYATGTDPGVAARNFSVSVTSAATDPTGNHLSSTTAWSFRTLRRITQTLGLPEVFKFPFSSAPNTPCAVGESSTDVAIGVAMGFGIASLPPGIVEWEAATIQGLRTAASPSAFMYLGTIHAYQFDGSLTSVTWSTPMLRDLGVFAEGFAGPDSVNALPALVDDYTNRIQRGQLSRYRLSFEVEHYPYSAVGSVQYACEGFYLVVRYLVP